MPNELQILSYVTVLGLAQLVAATHFMTLQRGLKWNLSPRDQTAPPLTGMAGRLDRAFKNFMETFPFFAAAVLSIHAMDKHSLLANVGALIYFIARLIYLPLYAAGIPVVRSLAWLVSLGGLTMVLLSLWL